MNSLRGGTLSESAIRLAPDTAIRCCFVGTVKGFDAPAMCPSNGVTGGGVRRQGRRCQTWFLKVER